MKTAIIDLETIPDKTLWSGGAVDEDDSVETKPRGRGRPKKMPFPPMYAHQIICAGFAVIEGNDCVGIAHVEASTKEQEKELLAWFPELMGDVDVIVTWNGAHFDIPVIQLRSLHHGVSQSWIDKDARNRYGSRHTDLCDIFTEYGGLGKTGYNLDTFAQMIGLPGKNGFDGSLVHAAFVAGKLDQITSYCKADVMQTAAVYLRWKLLRGMVTKEEYNSSIDSLIYNARQHEGMTATEFVINTKLLKV
jgi:predicted PolB exonuclease-like 3'-5' exonuclease